MILDLFSSDINVYTFRRNECSNMPLFLNKVVFMTQNSQMYGCKIIDKSVINNIPTYKQLKHDLRFHKMFIIIEKL